MSTQRISTWGGDYHQASTDSAITDGNFFGFTVCEDGTIVTEMSGGLNGSIPSPETNYLTIANLSGKSLKVGTLITIPLNEIIVNFDLSAGSVVLHKAAKE